MWIVAPTIAQLGENCSEMYFPKRDELWLRCVFAQPNASVRGCDVWMRISRSSVALETKRRYCSTKRALSVLPAPDSPLMTTAWFLPSLIKDRCAAAATANMCGGSFSRDMLDLYWCSCLSV